MVGPMINLTGIKKTSPSPGYLSDGDPMEVSLVGRPANRREYLLTKNRNKEEMDELLKAIESVEADNEQDLEKALEGYSEDAVAAAKAIARITHAYSDAVDTEVLAKALGIEAEVQKGSDEGADNKEELSKSDLEALNPELRKKVESLIGKSESLEERVDAVSKAMADAAEARQREEIRKRVDNLRHLGSETDDLIDIVKSVSDHAGDEAADKVVEMLKSANEVAAKGSGEIYTEKGSGSEGSTSSSAQEAYEEIEKRARKKVRESDDDTLTLSKAMKEVMSEDEDLARIYREN